MNKDERSAASTGADSERHRSNDLNPVSAPALSLPPQRLGSAMEGLTDAELREGWEHLFSTENPYNPVTLKAFTKIVRWVEALRQRPGAQAASEPGVKLDDIEADFLATRLRRLFAHFDYAVAGFAKDDASLIRISGSIIGGILANLDRQSARERPAQAEPMTDEREAFEAWAAEQGFSAHRLDVGDGESYADLRTQGVWDAWQARAILASPSAIERPGAQAPSTAARYSLQLVDAAKALQHAADYVGSELGEVYRERASKVFEVISWLAAPSTGGAETADADDAIPEVAAHMEQHAHLTPEQAKRAAVVALTLFSRDEPSAPAQAVETAASPASKEDGSHE